MEANQLTRFKCFHKFHEKVRINVKFNALKQSNSYFVF